VPSFVTRQWKTRTQLIIMRASIWEICVRIAQARAFGQFFDGNIGNGIQWISLRSSETLYHSCKGDSEESSRSSPFRALRSWTIC